MLLKDKRCIVSGVGPGLGYEIAMAFAREGADVAIGARTESYLEQVHAEIEALGRRAVHSRTDITDQAGVRSGDIVHADRHGAVTIPEAVADRIPAACDLLARKEAVILEMARAPGFTVARLREALARQDEIH